MESAKRQFVELYGSALVMNTYLKIALVLVSLVALGLLGLNFHTAARYSQVKPLVVRIDEVGRAEAVVYDASRYQPQPPELRYFLTQFVVKHFSRIRSTVQREYPDSLLFLEPALADLSGLDLCGGISGNPATRTPQAVLVGDLGDRWTYALMQQAFEYLMAGAALIAAILVSTWWVPGLRSTLIAGGPWLLLLAIGLLAYAVCPALVAHVLVALHSVGAERIVVVGPADLSPLRAALSDVPGAERVSFCVQDPPLGTGDAASRALAELGEFADGDVGARPPSAPCAGTGRPGKMGGANGSTAGCGRPTSASCSTGSRPTGRRWRAS